MRTPILALLAFEADPSQHNRLTLLERIDYISHSLRFPQYKTFIVKKSVNGLYNVFIPLFGVC